MSVIMPTYNYANYVSEAIASVLDQSMGNLELVVIDDGSTDRTTDILENIRDPRLRSVRTENRGKSLARNTGLELSRGRFVAFMDADDIWHPEKLERQHKLISESNVDICFTNFVRFDEKGTFPKSQFSFVPELSHIPRQPSASGDGWIIEEEAFQALIGTGQLAAWPSTLVIKGDLARSVAFPDTSEEVSEDLWYILLVASRCRKAAYINAPLAALRRHGANSYHSEYHKINADLAILRTLEKRAIANGLNRSQRAALSRRIGRGECALGYANLVSGSILDAGRAYFRALFRPKVRLNALKHLLALPFSRPLVKLRSRDVAAFDDPDERTAFPWTENGEFRDQWAPDRSGTNTG